MGKRYEPLKEDYEYDSQDRIIEYSNNRGDRYVKEYRDDNVIIYKHWLHGQLHYSWVKKLDECGRTIYRRTNRGLTVVKKYDDSGKLIYDRATKKNINTGKEVITHEWRAG